ncbi:MAG: hypothetical protein KDD04_05295, partial [Sinomicrobium sp.]|nr:hypothetical protein [Sinomicrobium sp.]
RRLDQAPDTGSDQFSGGANYWLGAYEKPASAFWWLFYYWGPEKFDGAMQAYFKQWQFRHPRPEDLQESLETYSGEDLSWLFRGLLYSTQHPDYAIKGYRQTGNTWSIDLVNKGEIAPPVPLQGLSRDSVVNQQWIKGFSGDTTISFAGGPYDQFVLDHFGQTLDVNRKNNTIKTKGLFKKLPPFRAVPLARVENEAYTSLYWLPMAGWNAYDGFQAGLLLHNRTLPWKRFEFDLLPLYGVQSKSFTGLGNVDYHWYPGAGPFQNITAGLNFRTFHFERKAAMAYDLQYSRWQPSLSAELRRPAAATFHHRLQYRLIRLNIERPYIGREEGFVGTGKNRSTIHEWSYSGEKKHSLHPFRFVLAIEQQSYTDVFDRRERYLKWSLDWQSKLAYNIDKYFYARIFTGGFLQNTRRNAGAISLGAFSLIDQAAMDYRHDDFYF